MKIRFDLKYFLLFIGIFIVEVIIALYVKDKFIRPYLGDVLVVGLIYAFIRTFIKGDAVKIAFGVFLFACFVEMLQYFRIVEVLGLEGNKLARIVIGTTFTWEDILCYFIGFIAIVAISRIGKASS